MAKRSLAWPIVTALIGGWLLLTALPNSVKGWAPDFLQPTLHLGLDLQGGTQLDFRISETEMEKQTAQLEMDLAALEAQNGSSEAIAEIQSQMRNIAALRTNLVEAIRIVLERRINSLGVSEAVITPSYYGNEKHLLVECPGVVDIQQCIDTVGKTILLEFKEEARGDDSEHEARIRELAARAEVRITASGESLITVGQDLGSTLGVTYADVPFFQDQLPRGLEAAWELLPGDPVLIREVELEPIEREGTKIIPRGLFFTEASGERRVTNRTIVHPREAMEHLQSSQTGVTLVQHEKELFDDLDPGYRPLLGELVPLSLIKGTREDGKRSILFVEDRVNTIEELAASHILVAYQGAARSEPSVTHTKEKALELAKEIHSRIIAGENFEKIAREESDGPSAAEGGSLGSFARGTMPQTFEEAALALKKGEVSDVIETEFGFHIIRLDEELKIVRGSLTFSEFLVEGEGAEQAQEQHYQSLQNRTVSRSEEQIPLRTLYFSFLPTGWKDTPLDGKHFERATVVTDPLTNIPLVQIVFDREGGELFHELTKRNIGEPIAIFVGGELVSAPVVQAAIPGGTAVITGSQTFDEANALAQDLNTGAIPAPIYLVGQATVEAALGDLALKQSIKAALIGSVLVSFYMIYFYRILGIVATVALTIYIILLTALLKLPVFLFTDQYVVLTLAGIAGIILSIGMAVDANILIFERIKEELQKGKLLQTAADTGFKRAWTSIRDSNTSTLLTAGILFLMGTSIVRGFAVTLSIGVMLSMLTSVLATRFLITLLYKSPVATNLEAFGVKQKRS